MVWSVMSAQQVPCVKPSAVAVKDTMRSSSATSFFFTLTATVVLSSPSAMVAVWL